MSSSRVLSIACLCLMAVAVESATSVTVKGRQLLVNNEPFTVKAVGYAPVPVGVDVTTTLPYGDYFTANYSSFWKRDLPLLRAMGANSVRLWGWANGDDHSAFLDAAYNGGVNPIYVIPTFYMAPGAYSDLSDTTVQQKLIKDFTLFTQTIANHDAILFYLLGDDLNAPWMYGPHPQALFNALNMLGTQYKTLEPKNPRPVSTSLNDWQSITFIAQYEPTTTAIDLWSINLFQGCTFGPLFGNFVLASKKPLFISEYGIDAWNDTAKIQDDKMQARCAANLWGEIVSNKTTVVGGAVLEYTDEYWKSRFGASDARHPGCPSYEPALHTDCGTPNANYPDKYVNDAWFGIVDAVGFQPRAVYFQLQELWKIGTWIQ